MEIVDPYTIRFKYAGAVSARAERPVDHLHRVEEGRDRRIDRGFQFRQGRRSAAAATSSSATPTAIASSSCATTTTGARSRTGKRSRSASSRTRRRASPRCCPATSTRSSSRRPPTSRGSRRDPKFTVTSKISHRVIYFNFDNLERSSPFITGKDGKPLDKNPLLDVRVRRAISKAINRPGDRRARDGGPGDSVRPARVRQAVRQRARAQGRRVRSRRREEAARRGRLSRRLQPDDPRPGRPLRQRREDRAGGRADADARRHRVQGRDGADGSVFGRARAKQEFSFHMVGWGASTGEASARRCARCSRRSTATRASAPSTGAATATRRSTT